MEELGNTSVDKQAIFFRQISLDDLEVLAELFSDQRVMKFYPRTWIREEVLLRIRKNQEHYGEYGYGLWAVYTVSDEFVGECGLAKIAIDGRDYVELSYLLIASMQGLGYATEAAIACVAHAVRITGQYPIAVDYPQNVASEKVAQKSGLRQQAQSQDSKGKPFTIYSHAAL